MYRNKRALKILESFLRVYFLISLLALPSYSYAQPPKPSQWQLTFSDEFNGPYLDTNKWMTTYFWGGRCNTANNEAQYYADDAFEFNNGILAIRADQRALEGYNYTSGHEWPVKDFSEGSVLLFLSGFERVEAA